MRSPIGLTWLENPKKHGLSSSGLTCCFVNCVPPAVRTGILIYHETPPSLTDGSTNVCLTSLGPAALAVAGDSGHCLWQVVEGGRWNTPASITRTRRRQQLEFFAEQTLETLGTAASGRALTIDSLNQRWWLSRFNALMYDLT